MPITHAKVSALSDGSDSGQVQPSDWNAEHVGGLAIEYVQATDPGAVGAGKLWLQHTAGEWVIWVRKANDLSWEHITASTYSDSNQPKGVTLSNDSSEDISTLALLHTKLELKTSGTAEVSGFDWGVWMDGDGVHVGPNHGGSDGDFNSPCVLSGSADPSAGAGIATIMGSLYMRNVGDTTGELWCKTGVADTAWTKVTP